jgi:hypothetical protein
MSLGGLFGGRRQPSSAEKLAMIEMELELNTTMFDKYVPPLHCIKALPPKTAIID